MKALLTALIVFSPLMSHAASYWCALANGLTPSETLEQGNTPYQEVQVDQISLNQIQIDITDHYGDGQNSKIIMAEYLPDTDVYSVGGIALGEYHEGNTYTPSVTIELSVEGRLSLNVPPFTYACEVSGDYRPSYEADLIVL